MPALPPGAWRAAVWAAAAAAAAAASFLSGCRAHAPTAPQDAVIAGGAPELPARPTYSDPEPPSQQPPPPLPPPAAGPPSPAPRREPPPSKKAVPPPREEQPPAEDPASEPEFVIRPSSSAAALFGGPRPDPGDQEGRPLTRRPDGGSIAPPGPPLRYFSPAPLRPQRVARRSPGARDDSPDELAFEPPAGGNARRPARAPATGLMLDDSIPEVGISEPQEIGSYHVQIASSPEFSKVLFDKIYPFMAEVDLEKDLKGAPPGLRTAWIRWSLVDLLDYEHPFVRPKRFRLAALARDGGD